MKPCIACGELKPLAEYYSHPQMADGHLNKCKTCVIAYTKQYRAENLEKVQKYDRQRGLLPHRKEGNKQRAHRYKPDPMAFRRKYPDKRQAHVIVGNAIRAGRLTKQPCVRCGKLKVHAHHEDYANPLDVTWLCTFCHGERHREINEERRQA